jgi:hypothetical protein
MKLLDSLEGPPDGGKKALATWFAQYLSFPLLSQLDFAPTYMTKPDPTSPEMTYPSRIAPAKDSRERAPGEDYSYLRPAPEPKGQPRLIGLYSPSPGCGKTTVAKALAPYGYERISFAQPLRDMLTPFLAALDYPATALTSPIHKETPIRELGISPRDLMRTLGTEWGRTCVNPDTWLILAGRSIDRIHLAGGYVVIDDVRFPNEANFILKRGGKLWKIERQDAVPASGHASDTSMADWSDFDVVIHNNCSLKWLIHDVASLIRYP